jgi:hypothetical protein
MLSLLAQAAPTATPSLNIPLDDPRYFIVAAVLSVPLLVTAVNGILQIIKFFKPDPPVHREYATKSELRDTETRLQNAIALDGQALIDMEDRINESRSSMEQRLHKEVSSVNTRVEQGNNSLQAELRTIQRTLGQLEGALKSRRGS